MLQFFTEQDVILDFYKTVVKHPHLQISDLTPALKLFNVLCNSI